MKRPSSKVLLQLSLALALQLLFLFSLELSIDLCALGRFVAVSASLVVPVSFWRQNRARSRLDLRAEWDPSSIGRSRDRLQSRIASVLH